MSIPPAAMKAVNWGVMAISFVLLAATSVFGKEVLDVYCTNMQYDGTTDDVVSEESFQNWETTMWGGLGTGIAPACVAAVLLFYQLGCSKSVLGSSIALTCILASALIAMTFGVELQTHFRGLFIGLLVGTVMMGVVLASGQNKVSAGSVMVQVGTAFLIFGGLSTALGAFALSRIEPCNTHRGCFTSASTTNGDSSVDNDNDDDTGSVSPSSSSSSLFTTVCDWSCCDNQLTSTVCAEYAATSADLCGSCQPCNIDTSISTKLWVCTGTGIALAFIALVLLIVRFAVPIA